ncbi:hypothetical protein [Glycomyces tenuis]|uniref:hypothetical protein n=1 Tax=Glycomyces tenuis TaxID=58116 RepID=UPI00047C3145|nr:hypothetical protein [Glycomyces tenuis]
MNAEIRAGKRAPRAAAPERADGRPETGTGRREILRDYGRTRTLITVDVETAPRALGGIPPWEVDPSKPRIVRLSTGPTVLGPDGTELPPKPKRRGRAGPRRGAELWVDKPLLRKRGWTETAIREYLPGPERLKRNPHPRGRSRPMPLWRPETVAEIEATERWRAWLQASLQRRGTTLRDLSKTFSANRYRAMSGAADAAVDAAVEAHCERRGTRRP